MNYENQHATNPCEHKVIAATHQVDDVPMYPLVFFVVPFRQKYKVWFQTMPIQKLACCHILIEKFLLSLSALRSICSPCYILARSIDISASHPILSHGSFATATERQEAAARLVRT